MRRAGSTLHRGARGSHCRGLSCCGAQLQTRRLSSCGSRAQSLRGMWDPPRPGLEPVSPALAGRFPTTASPGKPQDCHSFELLCSKLFNGSHLHTSKSQSSRNTYRPLEGHCLAIHDTHLMLSCQGLCTCSSLCLGFSPAGEQHDLHFFRVSAQLLSFPTGLPRHFI